MLKNSLSTPEIIEFNTLRFMAENFNIKPHELQNYDPEWIEKMLAVAEGEFIATKNQTGNTGSSGNSNTIVNKISTTYGGKK